MSVEDELPEESAEDFFENAPCGCLSTALDGTILKVNQTFEGWTGLERQDLVGKKRFQEILAPGGRIYHETHYAPLLRMQGQAKEIALEIMRADGSRLPVLVNSVVAGPQGGRQVIRTTMFDASDRRGYEEELLRARERERDVAQRLQRSMLAGDLPQAPGIEVAASYRPADRGLDIGGDWYDAFWLEDEKVGLVVGDVVGRGLEAAATMGQLRSATRAIAATGRGPAAVLEALDGYSHRHGVGAMATVVYAELDRSTHELRFACAGHPPPILVPAGEGAHLTSKGRSTPLDVHPRGDRARPEASCPLPPGSLFVVYTDGLVERRDQPIDVGFDRLLEEIEQRRTETPGDLASGLVRAFQDRDLDDDACVLALSLR